jgi:hypothetical protein
MLGAHLRTGQFLSSESPLPGQQADGTQLVVMPDNKGFGEYK